MAHATFLRHYGPKLILALILTFTSGVVDIVGYVGVFHLFTAHLTGATVQLGRGLISHSWTDVYVAAVIVAAFMGGSLFGRAAIEIGSRRNIRRISSVTLTIEALLLLCVALTSTAISLNAYQKIAILAAAMGLQTATLTGVGPLTVHTTFVTGMLNKIAQLVTHVLFRIYDREKSTSASHAFAADQQRDAQMAMFLGAVWCCYVAGATFGTWSFGLWGIRALSFAIVLLVFALVVDGFSPLSMEEEKEQSER